MKKTISQKRDNEKAVVYKMILIYCRHNHKTKGNTLCESCEKLKEYALLRLDKCPFIETKTFCKYCKVHCYTKEMQEKIRTVMKFSGPRMLLYHPVMTVKHLIENIKNKKKRGTK